jgi:CO/xanthine dehydrogenase Mo-binding subunit
VDNVEVRSRCVYTNKPSAGPFRGFGVPQVTWSHESLVDELARESGVDPAEFRRRNLLREGDVSAVGTPMHSADFLGCLDAVTEAVGWDTPLERADGRLRRGRGVAVGIKAVLTPTISNAVLQLNQDASATLLISTVDMGQGSDTIMAQIAAEALCLGEGQVRVVTADTDVTPYDTITAGSRSTYHIMGIGHALFDQLVFDEGQIVNGTLLDYQLPSVLDLPDKITPIIVESPHRTGPYGAKGVGETTIIPLAPAIANAVRDAIGIRFPRLPLTPERILTALADQKGDS